jgi:hypothetical protein
LNKTPKEIRDLEIGLVKRTLFGPTDNIANNVCSPDPIDMNWYTARDSNLEETGPAALETNEDSRTFKIDPNTGQEILSNSPLRLYGVGILYPKMAKEVEESLTLEQAREIEDTETKDSIIEVNELEPSAEDSQIEDNLHDIHNLSRPSSFSVSFHIKTIKNNIGTIKLYGATYNNRTKSATQEWARQSHNTYFPISLEFLEGKPKIINMGGIDVEINSKIAPSPSGVFVTISVRNVSSAEDLIRAEERSLFQTRLFIELSEDLLPYHSDKVFMTKDDKELAMLYSNYKIYAVGHGCDAIVSKESDKDIIEATFFPVVNIKPNTPDIGPDYEIAMDSPALSSDGKLEINLGTPLSHAVQEKLNQIIDDYEAWFIEQSNSKQDGKEIFKQESETNRQILKDTIADMKSGLHLILTEAKVRECFKLASYAMYLQRSASSKSLHSNYEEEVYYPINASHKWRPFQIAFLLMSIPSLVDKSNIKEKPVDIIWMPTGGGKTEAYLGLAAFTILWERNRGRELKKSRSMNVFMRYTLRLLTTQQVERAASMICALEYIRKLDKINVSSSKTLSLGVTNFSVGALLGAASTPNTTQKALEEYKEKYDRKNQNVSGFILSSCPWCRVEFDPIDKEKRGYKLSKSKNEKDGATQTQIQLVCPNSKCQFSEDQGIPVLEIDEKIFEVPPSLVIGTVDKVAAMALYRTDQWRKLFGLVAEDRQVIRKGLPPALFIQDELHLIANELGSIDGLYEVALEEICKYGDGGEYPKIVGATATVKSYKRQVLNLYGREQARLFPPPYLDIDDNFFSHKDSNNDGRTFVGISVSGFSSTLDGQLKSTAAINHASGILLNDYDIIADPWWTNLMFFSSRNSLARLLSSISYGLRSAIFKIYRYSGRYGGVKLTPTRYNSSIYELTATAVSNVNKTLALLSNSIFPNSQIKNKQVIDLCLATSMIEVGLDVPRLGLMTVIGQPKSFNQYIQVTGRVGRSRNSPAAIFVVLSPYNVRDRSNLETFTTMHERLYASVEPISITPFSGKALEKGFAGAFTLYSKTVNPAQLPLASIQENNMIAGWTAKAKLLGKTDNLGSEIERLLIKIKNSPIGEQSDWSNIKAVWKQIPTSMRSVDQESYYKIDSNPFHSKQPEYLINIVEPTYNDSSSREEEL